MVLSKQLKTIKDSGRSEVVDSLDMVGHFRFCTGKTECNHKGTLFFYRVEGLDFAKNNWLQLSYEVTDLLRIIPDRGKPEADDTLKMVGDFSFTIL